jgi:hypothetical protein
MSRPAAGQKASNRRPEQARSGHPAGAPGGPRQASKRAAGATAPAETGSITGAEALPQTDSAPEEAPAADPAPRSGVTHALDAAALDAAALDAAALDAAALDAATLDRPSAVAEATAPEALAAASGEQSIEVAPRDAEPGALAAVPPAESTNAEVVDSAEAAEAVDSAEPASSAEAVTPEEEGPPSPVNYDEEGIGEVEIDGSIYRFDSGKQGTALCLSRRQVGAWRWNYLGELRWDGRDLRSKALERSLLTQLSTSLRALAEAAN